MPDQHGATDEFVELITQFQPRLFAYILSLVGNVNDANDILQEVNIVLWRESAKFESGSSFKAWSFRVAYFQFRTHRQKQFREKLVFSDALVDALESEARQLDDLHESRRQLLTKCLESLSPSLLKVIGLRYLEGLAVSEIARRLDRSANAISQVLYRGRKSLIACVKRRSGFADAS
ncbi:MAG: sigma-70 family RNA polymerase sigma factor [Planctomycetota bacterium]